ncbi:Lrp/AsnC family transcriptional regulator [Laribacter hongkongensis]|nr:Lrp/AsnC family transcriptional regulator [Laribacter hongkongensis]
MTTVTRPWADKALLRLINDFQDGFPVQPAPFAVLAGAMDSHWNESRLIAALQREHREGILSRIGAVFVPNTVGSSTLAALAVPDERLEAVADLVSRFQEVNHNYRRDHHYNLWFVVAAGSPAAVEGVLSRIHAATGLLPLNLPLVREYHVGLGFSFLEHEPLLARPAYRSVAGMPLGSTVLAVGEQERLLAALSPGLPLVAHPYRTLGDQCGLTEGQVTGQICLWLQQGVIRRFGMIVRHHELGYRANAMCVWQIDDPAERERIAGRLAREPAVTLCYERPARLPDWPYQLFTMIHARDVQGLESILTGIRQRHRLESIPQAVLRSTHRYKQSGAHYGLA